MAEFNGYLFQLRDKDAAEYPPKKLYMEMPEAAEKLKKLSKDTPSHVQIRATLAGSKNKLDIEKTEQQQIEARGRDAAADRAR